MRAARQGVPGDRRLLACKGCFGDDLRYGVKVVELKLQVIEARYPHRSTALVTNIDFDAWGDYLGDPPLAMAFLDRVVDGAIVLKLEGKSYRAHRARRVDAKPSAKK